MGKGTTVDHFPTGMRVLVVDDDPTCLKHLETLLQRCQYNVATTNRAVEALELLREVKFDIVISDVHMPDMDGFKLLECVGLELDMPVIMLSANGDPKLVMKGIRSGAVDYLVKPVRILELKNIWQHVVRKKKLTGRGKAGDRGDGESRKAVAALTVDVDKDEQLSRKRKSEDSEDEEEERDEDSRDNEDQGTQKKPRVIWSKELHDKFVSAVEELGRDKAFPKKILDKMNVEGLTRENVASHLQKYRIFLKKFNNGSSPHLNTAASTLGGNDLYNSFNRSLVDLGKIRGASSPLTSLYQPGGMLGRLNTAGGLSLRSLSTNPSSLLQSTTARGPTINGMPGSLPKFQPVILTPKENANPLLHGIPLQQLHRFQHYMGSVSHVPDFKTTDAFASCDVDSMRMPNGSGSSSHVGLLGTRVPNNIDKNSFILNGNSSFFTTPARNVEPLDGFLMNYHDKHKGSWSGALQSSTPVGDNFVDGVGVQSDPLDNAIARAISSLEGSRENIQIHEGGLAFLQNHVDNRECRNWQENRSSANGIICSSSSNPVVPANGSFGHTGTALSYKGNFDGYSMDWPNSATPSSLQKQNEFQSSESDSKFRSEDNFLDETSSILADFIQNRNESLEDVLASVTGKQGNCEMATENGDYSLDDVFNF